MIEINSTQSALLLVAANLQWRCYSFADGKPRQTENILKMIAPLPSDETARLDALRKYNILDTDPEDIYDDLTRLAAYICDAPIAVVTLVDDHRQWFKSVIGLEAHDITHELAFCAHTIPQTDLMIVHDATEDIRFADNPLVTGDPGIRFYAGMPLTSQGGHSLGLLCVFDTIPRSLTLEQEVALRTLARQVSNQVEFTRTITIQDRLLAEKEQAQHTLKVSELRYRRLFETAQDGILILDAETARITNANPFMINLLGYSHDEFLGKELWEIGLHKDKQASQEAFQLLLKTGYIRYESLPLETQGGKQSAVEFVSNVYPEGKDLVIQCNKRDITDRKAAEDALRESEQFAQASLNGLSTAIAILDSEGSILAVNQAWRQFLPDNPSLIQNVAVGANYLRSCENATGEEMEEAVRVARGIRSVSADELEIFTIEYPCHSPQEQRWFSMRVTRFPGDGPARVVVAHEDITKRKQVELELEKALKVAQEQADHDPLTNLLNRRAFHKSLKAEADYAQREETNLAVVVLDIDNFKFFNDVYGHLEGDQVLRLVAEKLQEICKSQDILARFGGDEFALILPDLGRTTLEEVEARLHAGLETLSYRTNDGESLIPVSVSLGTSLFPAASTNCQEVLRQADERLLWSKTGGGGEKRAQLVRMNAGNRVQGFSMLDALVTAVDNKDRYTRKHSEDVMEYSLMIVRELGLGESEQHMVAVAALIHDVGKIGVPDAILRKPGRLTDQEFEAVKQHPMMGSVMVGAVPGLEDTLDAVLHHHERWDGGGYPFGLEGEKTPLAARLMAVADAFSAMTTDRPYRKGMDQQQALDILQDGSGTQWDPKCVSAFLAGIEKASGHGFLPTDLYPRH